MGLTQRQISEPCNITEPFYSMIETGERRPSVETARAIADELKFKEHGLKWTRFFEEEPETITTR